MEFRRRNKRLCKILVKMNILEVVATKRSGQHAIISWIIRNMTDMVLSLKNDLGVIKLEYVNNKILYWNDVNNDQDFGMKLFKESGLANNLENLVVNYEDVNNNYSFFSVDEVYRGPLNYKRFSDIDILYGKRLIILRDFYNCLASRYQQNISGEYPHSYDQRFINLWKNNAKFLLANPKMGLKFEDWLIDENKRKQILWDYFFIEERYTPDKISGRTSSFYDGKYNDRFDMINLPNDIKDLIKKDSELHYLMGALGYRYKEF
jgi:hypothetical protein